MTDAVDPSDVVDFGLSLEADDRPWGYFKVLRTGPRHKVKVLVVLPGERTSLQCHRYRREIWTVLSGTGLLHIDGNQFSCLEGQTFHVGYCVLHRLQNTGVDPLIILETQIGSYCGEDDITRFEDDYDRKLAADAQAAPYRGLGATLASHHPK